MYSQAHTLFSHRDYVLQTRLHTCFGNQSLRTGCIVIGCLLMTVYVLCLLVLIALSKVLDEQFPEIGGVPLNSLFIALTVFVFIPVNFILIRGTLKGNRSLVALWIAVYIGVCAANITVVFLALNGLFEHSNAVITISVLHLPPVLYMIIVAHSHLIELWEKDLAQSVERALAATVPREINHTSNCSQPPRTRSKPRSVKPTPEKDVAPPAYEDLDFSSRLDCNIDPPSYVAVLLENENENKQKTTEVSTQEEA